MKAVILAGGKGTRLAPFTYILPKPMMPVGDHAILEVLLKQLSYSGIKDIVLTVGHLAELMQAYFKDGQQYGLKISYSVEDQPLGTAGPLTLLDSLDETFLVCNGDVLTLLDVNDLIQFHREQGAVVLSQATCALTRSIWVFWKMMVNPTGLPGILKNQASISK